MLENISLVTNNFGDAIVFADILEDWFKFLGGKPGEVVVVDCGSDPGTHEVYWKLFQEKKIDKLQMIQGNHDDNVGGVESGFKKEYFAGAIASKPYLLWFHVDTLPFRQGHEDWLKEAVGYLDRDDVLAIGGSFNMASKHHDAWPGWYFSDKCSLNFALMKQSTYMKAVHEYANDFILSAWRAPNPAVKIGPDSARYVFELAFEKYIETHKKYTLCKMEDPSWTVFHTNVHGDRLQKTREKYLARKDLAPYMNLGAGQGPGDPFKARHYGIGMPTFIQRLRIAFGASFLGPVWRKLRAGLR